MVITNNARLMVQIASILADSLDLGTVKDDLEKLYTLDLPTGTGSGQANQLFHDQRVVNSGATDSLDLAGVLQNAIRQTVTFSSIKAVIVKAAAGNTTNLSITRPAANGVPIFAAAGDACPIGPGGIFVWCSPGAGVTVTGGTGDLLDIVNAAGAAATYDVIIIGVQ